MLIINNTTLGCWRKKKREIRNGSKNGTKLSRKTRLGIFSSLSRVVGKRS